MTCLPQGRLHAKVGGGDAEEVGQQHTPKACGNGLRVELHAKVGLRAVGQRHDNLAVTLLLQLLLLLRARDRLGCVCCSFMRGLLIGWLLMGLLRLLL